MGFFDHDDSQERYAYEQVQTEHKSSLTHELISGAGAFAAMKAYQDHQEANGKPQSFEMAKNIIAGLAGMEVDKLIETKGLDAIDRQRAKHEAEEKAKAALANSNQFGQQRYEQQPYGGGGGGGYGGDQGGYGGGQGGYGGGGGGYDRRDEGRGEYGREERRGEYGPEGEYGREERRGEYGREGEYERRGEGGYGGEHHRHHEGREEWGRDREERREERYEERNERRW